MGRPDWTTQMPLILPAAEQRARETSGCAIRQRVGGRGDEIVQAVFAAPRPAALDVGRRLNVAVGVAGRVVPAATERVGGLERQPATETAVSLHLQSVVLRLGPSPGRHFSRASVRLEQRPTGVVGAQRHSGVHVDCCQHVASAVAEVGGLHRPLAWQLTLVGHVPRVHRRFVQVGRHVGEGQHTKARRRCVDDPVVWYGEDDGGRKARRHRPRGCERARRVELKRLPHREVEGVDVVGKEPVLTP